MVVPGKISFGTIIINPRMILMKFEVLADWFLEGWTHYQANV